MRRRVERACAVCGAAFSVKASKGPSAAYCSRACKAAAQRQPEARRCAHCGAAFTVRSSERQRYCSRACRDDAARKDVELACAHCGRRFSVPPSLVAVRRHCSRTCKSEAQQRRVTLTCAGCAGAFSVPASLAHRRYCSRACADQARRRRRNVTCAHCGVVFSAPASGPGRRFCARACWRAWWGQQARVDLTCAHCGGAFRVRRSVAATGRRYCSRACYLAAHGALGPAAPPRVVSCAVCAKAFRAVNAKLLRGQARFCSWTCYSHDFRARALEARVPLNCARCGTRVMARPHQAARHRKFCSRQCYLLHTGRLDHAPCLTCGAAIRAPRWQKRRFCSPRCAYAAPGRGRPREAENLRREARVLELHAQGLTSRRIVEQLGGGYTASTIRSILHRARGPARAGPEGVLH